MTTAQNMSMTRDFSGNHAVAKRTGLKDRLVNYYKENALVILSAMASMSGSSYAFFRYVYPELIKTAR